MDSSSATDRKTRAEPASKTGAAPAEQPVASALPVQWESHSVSAVLSSAQLEEAGRLHVLLAREDAQNEPAPSGSLQSLHPLTPAAVDLVSTALHPADDVATAMMRMARLQIERRGPAEAFIEQLATFHIAGSGIGRNALTRAIESGEPVAVMEALINAAGERPGQGGIFALDFLDGLGQSALTLLVDMGNLSHWSHVSTPETARHRLLIARLLSAGADINLFDARQRTPLMLAARDGNEPLADYLIKAGASSKQSAESPYHSALTLAALNGHEALIVRLFAALIDETGARSPEAGKQVRCALLCAAEAGQADAVDRLLTIGQEFIDAGTLDLALQKSIAADAGARIVASLLTRGAGIRCERRDVFTMLEAASGCRGAKVFELIWEKRGSGLRANPEWRDRMLPVAARAGSRTVVVQLLNLKANIDSRHRVWGSALKLAIEGGYSQIVRVLLNHSPHLVTSGENAHLLAIAVLSDCEATVALLLEEGMPVRSLDKQGDTALTVAAASGRLSMVNLLLGRNAECDFAHGKRWLPAEAAAQWNHPDVLDCLLAKMPAPGLSCAKALSRVTSEAGVELLLARGGGSQTHRPQVLTALHLACERGDVRVFSLLLDCEAGRSLGKEEIAALRSAADVAKHFGQIGAGCHAQICSVLASR
jgi:uncharacterized protein